MDNKRTILAVALCFVVALAWQMFFSPKKPAAPAPEAASAAAAPMAEGALAAAPSGTPEGQTPAPAGLETAPDDVAVAETRATIANDVLTLTFTSRGARIIDAVLSRYHDVAGAKGVPLNLLPMETDVAGVTTLPVNAPSRALPYRLVASDATSATFAFEAVDGLRIEKRYTLSPGERYDLTLDIRVVNGRQTPLRDRVTAGLVRDFGGTHTQYTFQGPAYLKNDSLEELDEDDLEKGVAEAGGIAWAAMAENYFLVAQRSQSAVDDGLRMGRFQGLEKVGQVDLISPEFEIAPGASYDYSTGYFLGPKLVEVLEPLGWGLEKSIHYGWFGPIGVWFLKFLKLIYGIVGNWGIAIILLTTLVKLAMWPLSAKSFDSMARMKELQPKVAKLKERYGKDQQRMNVEMMQLYKTHKVNPLGGCLPMLLQIPVFFALYRVLLQATELRHAPFALWIVDLSAKDPYYITPLLMGASMFLQQKLTPMTGAQEMQAKMMMYGMPILFTVLFMNFPAGLVLYWLMNNVLSIAQQAMMLRKKAAAQAA